MPPKAKAVSDAPVVRRPRSAISDDPEVEKRREQNRQAGATHRAKVKAEKERNKAGAKTSLASIAEGSPAKAKIIINKPISQAVVQKMSEEEAKNIISRAVQMGKASGELRLLSYTRARNKVKEKAEKWLKKQQVEIENGKLAYVYIKMRKKTFINYIKESYPHYVELIEYHINRNVDYEDKKKGDNYTIYLKYRPYQDYDLFVFSYLRKDGTIKEADLPVSYTADVRFSTYLQNEYWRYTYYKVEESQGRFTENSIYDEYEGFRWEEGKKSVYEKYPALEFDDLEANTDKIKEVDENETLVRRAHLKDEYDFYQAEDWWQDQENEKFDDEHRTIYFDKKGNMIANLPTYDKFGNEIERNIDKKGAQTASANLGGASSGASNISNVSNTSSIKRFLTKIKKEIDDGKKVRVPIQKKKGQAQTAPVNMASSSVASSSVASSSMASSNASTYSNDSDYASNWSSTNATSVATSVATNGSLWGASSTTRNIVAL